MKVTFKVNYHTVWGESLYLLGDCAQMGSGKVEQALLMNADTNLDWTISIDLDTLHNITYGYIVKTDHGIIRRKEWGKGHNIDIDANCSACLIVDQWQDIPDVSEFYSSAFTKGIFGAARTTKAVSAHAGEIMLSVFAPQVQPCEEVAIVGESDTLGQWNPTKGLRLNDKDFPKWSIALSSPTHTLAYKFVVRDKQTHELKRWETGENRRLEPSAQPTGITIHNGLHIRTAETQWKGAGTAVPVFSLRSNDDFGVGDFYDLVPLIDWVAQTGQHIIQILPINDTTMTHKWTDSYPYNACSSFALHPMYLRPNAIAPLKDKKLEKKLRAEADKLNKLSHIDYEKANSLKCYYTRLLFTQLAGELKASAQYRAFVNRNAFWLKPYAAYCTLREQFKTPDHSRWGEYATYNEVKVAEYSQAHTEQIDYVYFVQYFLDKQLSHVVDYAHSRNVSLKGDVPIGVSTDSVDVWMYPKLFNLGCQAGAPPDDFAVNGQNWGFPTYNWAEMQKDGYSWWKRRFVKMADYFDAYRIDHILGFFRIWQIPFDSRHGILGTFYPALPFTAEQMRQSYDFWIKRDLYTTPFIHESFIEEYFGDYSAEAKERFLKKKDDYRYELQPFVATQQKVVSYFTQFPDSEPNMRLREGLLQLIDNVLFITDRDDPNRFHPRINAQKTKTYDTLTPYEKSCFDRLYEDFFYHRHNDFWRSNAMAKLPALTSATDMLVCGEDLGMIPACVADVMKQQRYLSLEIPRMPKRYGQQPGITDTNPYLSVCASSTHDMPGIRGWWEEDNAATQRYYNNVLGRQGKAPAQATPEICQSILATCLQSPSILTILPLQDWLSIDGSLRRESWQDEVINIPAEPRHYWRYRMHLSLEDLLHNTAFTAKVKSLIAGQ